MKSNSSALIESKNIIRPIVGTALVLLIPLIAMQFNNGVNWTSSDFVIAGIVLLVTGLIYELIVGKIKNVNHRLAAAALLVLAFLYVWAELAVGIFFHFGS